ncbi:MAG TPA: hypothetical protein VNW51_02570 [Mucilaginibacter sp.]|jgi:hypothetical protein|nr:hypothetical protein [Mucilaginibacter sp.]
MIDIEYFKSEDFKRYSFYISVALYLTVVFLPCLFCGAWFLFAEVIFLIAGFTAFFMGSDLWMIGIFWLASPLLFVAWYHYSQRPGVSLICACVSLVCWATILPFLATVDSPDYTAGFYAICAIYFLGLLGITVILQALIIQLKNQPKPESIAYEN